MRPTISRRDFLNGVALSVVAGGTLSPRELLAAAQLSDAAPDYYPPTLTGMRGSHEGSYEAAHALAWRGERPDRYDALDEEYDLVVVGGGISGLAAAYLYRKHAGDDARILVLDNHDDFGGHAKRNEFHAGGRMLLGFGGSINLEQDYMSPRAHGLLEEIGVDFEKLEKAVHPDYLLSNSGAPSGIHLSAEEYGRRRLVVGHWSKAWSGAEDSAGLIDDLGLSERDTRKLRELAGGERDFLEGLSSEERLEYVRSTSYATFLSNRVGLSRAAARVFAPMLRALFGVGIESVSVREAVLTGVAGPNPLTGQPAGPYEPSQYPAPRYPMFPDGNASVARLFVRKLVPAIAPGSSMQDIVTARFDYSALDREDSAVRIRLNSTAVKVEHSGSDAVEVSYVTGGRAFRVRSRHCILACYNSMIPHLCPELPEAQREQLEYGSKVPFAWVNVLLRNGRSVRGSGASVFLCPGSDFGLVSVAPPVTLGDYGATDDPDGPLVVFLGTRRRRRTMGAGPGGISIAWAAAGCSIRPSRRSRRRSKASSHRCSATSASTPTGTSKRSPSTAGPTATLRLHGPLRPGLAGGGSAPRAGAEAVRPRQHRELGRGGPGLRSGRDRCRLARGGGAAEAIAATARGQDGKRAGRLRGRFGGAARPCHFDDAITDLT